MKAEAAILARVERLVLLSRTNFRSSLSLHPAVRAVLQQGFFSRYPSHTLRELANRRSVFRIRESYEYARYFPVRSVSND